VRSAPPPFHTSNPPDAPHSPNALTELAERYGVQPSFVGNDGRVHRAEDAVIMAILAALGAPIAPGSDGAAGAAGAARADVADALAERRQAQATNPLEPVLVHRVGRAASAEVTLPARVHPRDVWCTVALDDGQVRRQRLISNLTSMHATSAVDGPPGNRYRFRLDEGGTEPIGPGYHRVTVEWPGARASALLIAAPRCPPASHGWGLFLPLHALRTEQDWGVGSYADMAELGQWAGEMGASMLGALPLYPAFLDPPADPSPYLPVSRLAYNEVFVDPTVLPELAAAPEARRLLDSDEFVRQLTSAHCATLVDYEAVSHLRRQVLTPMAEALLTGGSARRDAFCAWVDAHPELLAYARFRAAGDRLGHRPGVPDHPNHADHNHHDDHANDHNAEPTLAYHVYAQWVAAEQLTAAASAMPLYADLPIGVHPEGFDPVWAPDAFVPGAHGGAPPDFFFSGGQDWAFPPLHPERIRKDGYDYFIGVLRRAFRHAAYLRVDHIMGLQRLYWIPEGFDARHGAYVSYRADELHAVVALEAHRAGAVVVGEDLGTVPDGVRARMAEDRMLRSFVLQFESSGADPLPPAPAGVLASWGTHDLPRFAAYFAGDDIDQREREAEISSIDAAAERAGRAHWRSALLRALGIHEEFDTSGEELDAPDGERAEPALAARALRGCLLHLASSAADLVLVDLEDLWGEHEPQNRPGTGVGGANWRRRGQRTLHEARSDTATTEFLRALTEFRDDVPVPAADVAAPQSSSRVGALR
jgi:4-alpha-glucanotransferase